MRRGAGNNGQSFISEAPGGTSQDTQYVFVSSVARDDPDKRGCLGSALFSSGNSGSRLCLSNSVVVLPDESQQTDWDLAQ